MNQEKSPSIISAVDSTTSKRIQYWDIAKGIAIILMILGHTDMPVILKGAIFSFHMPFFIIANGYFIKSYDIKKKFFRSVKTLLVPYFITCIISAVVYTILYRASQPPINLFLFKIKAMLGGMSKISTKFQSFDSVWVVWFVCTLFITRNLYVIIMKLCEKKRVLSFCIIGLLAYSGYWIGEFYAFMPWSLDVALVSLIFIAAGDWLHKTDYLERNYVMTFILPFIIWTGIMFFTRSGIELAVRSYPAGILTIVEAVAGSLALISFSKYMERFRSFSRIWSWIGKNSMLILGIHCIEMMYFDWQNWLFVYLPVPMNWIWLSLVKSILILVLTWVIEKVRKQFI